MASSSPCRVLGLVDLHWSGRGEPRLPDLDGVDLVLLGGDLTHFRGTDVARRLVLAIRQAGPEVRAVCGNCDLPEMEEYLSEEGIGLDRRAEEIGGMKLLGLSGGLPFGGCPYERTEEDYARACTELFAVAAETESVGPTVLVSHQPPYGTCCDLARGRHVGSRAIRSALEEHQPDLVLSGHIHEAVGRDRIGRTTIVNPGPARGGGAVRFDVSTEGIRLLDE